MTVSGTDSRERYSGNDSTVNFPITFAYVADADIKVIHIDASGVETDWILNGAGATGFTIVSAAVVANTAPANGTELVIYRETPITQETEYEENRATPAPVTEATIDKLTMVSQELDDANDRAMTLPVTTEEDVSAVLPAPVSLELMRWNEDADALEGVTSESIAGSIMASNFVVDTYNDGVDFTAGVTTELTLTSIPGSENNTQIFFDGVYQEKSGYSLVGSVLTFAAPIPGGVLVVEVMYILGTSVSVPADNSVTTPKLFSMAVTAAKLAADAVETAKIKALAVTAAKLAADAVETAKIKDLNITFAKLAAALALDEGDMASNSATALSTQQAIKTYTDTLTAEIGTIESSVKNLVVTRPSVSTVTITADVARLLTAAGVPKRFTAVNETADITASGADGLDTGAEASSTWYHMWLIAKADGTIASLLSLSATAPTMPAEYTYKLYVGSVYNYVSGNFLDFRQEGVHVEYAGLQIINAGGFSTGAWTAQDATVFFPPTAKRIKMVISSTASDISFSPRSDGNAGVYNGFQDGPTTSFGSVLAAARTSHVTGVIRYVSSVYYWTQSASTELYAIGWEY